MTLVLTFFVFSLGKKILRYGRLVATVLYGRVIRGVREPARHSSARQLVSWNHPRRRQRRPRTPSRTCSSFISLFLSSNAKNQPPSDLCRPCSFQDLLGIFSVFPQVLALFAACEAGQSGHGDCWTVVPASIGTA